jgi:hypothetical protein
MTKKEIRALLKRLEKIEPDKWNIEDLTDTIVEICGIAGIDDIVYGSFSRLGYNFPAIFTKIILFGNNAAAKKYAVGYFLASGSTSNNDFIDKFIKLQRYSIVFQKYKSKGVFRW